MRFGGGDMSNIKLKEIVEVVVDNKGYTHGDKRRTQQVLAQRYKDLIGKTYRHFKGGLYEVIDIAVHSENAGLMVIYKSKKDPALVCARTLNMFLSDVDKGKYPLARQDQRFVEVRDETDCRCCAVRGNEEKSRRSA